METQQQLALLLVGVIAPFLFQLIKQVLQWEGAKAFWMVFVASIALAAFVYLATGGAFSFVLTDPIAFVSELARVGGEVFALASFVYKAFLNKA